MNTYYFLEQESETAGIKSVYPGLYKQIAENVNIGVEPTLNILTKKIYFQSETNEYTHFKAILSKDDGHLFPFDFLIKLSFIFSEDNLSPAQMETLLKVIIDSYLKFDYFKEGEEFEGMQEDDIFHFFKFLHKLEPSIIYSFFTSLYAVSKQNRDFLEIIQAPCLSYNYFFTQHFSDKRKDIENKFNQYYKWPKLCFELMYWVYFPFTCHYNKGAIQDNINLINLRIKNSQNISSNQLMLFLNSDLDKYLENAHLPSLLRTEGDLLEFADLHPYYTFKSNDDQKLLNFNERKISSFYPISSQLTKEKKRDFERVIDLIRNNKFISMSSSNIHNEENAIKRIETVYDSIKDHKMRKDSSFLMDCLIFGASIVASEGNTFECKTTDFKEKLKSLKIKIIGDSGLPKNDINIKSGNESEKSGNESEKSGNEGEKSGNEGEKSGNEGEKSGNEGEKSENEGQKSENEGEKSENESKKSNKKGGKKGGKKATKISQKPQSAKKATGGQLINKQAPPQSTPVNSGKRKVAPAKKKKNSS